MNDSKKSFFTKTVKKSGRVKQYCTEENLQKIANFHKKHKNFEDFDKILINRSVSIRSEIMILDF